MTRDQRHQDYAVLGLMARFEALAQLDAADEDPDT